MNDKLLLGVKAREKVLAGAYKIAEAVKLTLGPKGRNVLIERQHASPLITNDGVTIARDVKLECPYESMGAQVLREASIKTNTEAGDGTTTSIVLAQAILEHASRYIAAGVSPVFIKEGLLVAADFVVTEVAKAAKSIRTDADIRAIAINSCSNIADGIIVADAVSRVGAKGIITIEENKTGTTTLCFVDGLEIACELASPYFCEDPNTLSTTFENAKVFITDKRINSIKEILATLEDCAREKYPLVIIADDYSAEVLSALVLNKVRAGLRICALKCNIFSGHRDAILGDLAALAGAEVRTDFSDDGIKLGTCDKAVMSMENSKFISKSSDALKKRIQLILAQIARTDDEYNKTSLSERLARLTGGVAIISVGCATEIEQKEKRLRIEDALAATRAACEEGIVAGGGLALLRVKKILARHMKAMPKNQIHGAQILLEILDAPFRQICINSDINPDLVQSRITRHFGFDASNGKFVDMFDTGIVDPAKVVKCALKNAASVAGTLLTTEGIVLQ